MWELACTLGEAVKSQDLLSARWRDRTAGGITQPKSRRLRTGGGGGGPLVCELESEALRPRGTNVQGREVMAFPAHFQDTLDVFSLFIRKLSFSKGKSVRKEDGT